MWPVQSGWLHMNTGIWLVHDKTLLNPRQMAMMPWMYLLQPSGSS